MSEFEQVFSLIHEGVQPQIDYNKFKEMLIDYVENLMKGILCGNANYVCRIEQLNKGHRGSEGYDSNTNTFGIIISDAVARSIYKGTNPFNIFTVFHELSHVFDEYNIHNKDFKDANLKKICVEMGLRQVSPLGYFFYKENYKSVAIEAHANLLGAELTRDFYKKCNLSFKEEEEQGLLFLEFFALRELNNPNRSYTFLLEGKYYNDYKLSLSKIVSEMKEKEPVLYRGLVGLIGRDNLTFEDENSNTEFETKLYGEHAILELSDIIYDPLFTSLVENKAEYRPKV